MARRTVTLADVAAEAGTSTATASFVINDTPGKRISDSTRDRVRTVAERLGYSGSHAARTLARGHSDLVLLQLPDLALGAVMTGIQESLTKGCSARGLQLLAFSPDRKDGSAALVRTLRPSAVIMLVQPRTAPLPDFSDTPIVRWVLPGVEEARSTGTGARRAGEPREGVPAIDVEIPAAQIGQIQARALLSAGHERFAFVGPGVPELQEIARGRCSGVLDEAAAQGLEEPRIVQLVAGGAAVPLLKGLWEQGVTGLCAYNDAVALALLAAAREIGIDVPGMMGIVGVDDDQAGRFYNPPLTTVALDINEVVQSLLNALDELGLVNNSPSTSEHPPASPVTLRRRGTV